MYSVEILDRKVSHDQPVFIIAEAGVNHNGSLEMAKQLAYEAKNAGADCVKFQTFKASRVVTRSANKASYQLRVTDPDESQIDMLQKLELSKNDHEKLFNYCQSLGIIFMSTPYNEEDVDFLDDLGVCAFKLASISCVEPSFLKYVAKKNKPVILSTGMASLADVDSAVSAFKEVSDNGLILLQCTTNYPSQPDDANLLAIKTMQESFKLLVGYSDHMQNNIGCIASVVMGACVIEKHFTLDKSLAGPDHSCSANLAEFSSLVKSVRMTEKMLGNGIKTPAPIEIINAKGMRRSIVVKKSVKMGEIFSTETLTLKRPADGVHPRYYEEIIGKKASKNIGADTILQMSDVEW
jgi:N,N'-diacetyllegionaminate synthase